MAWLILFIAGLFEVGWAVGLKYADGFTKLWPSVWTAASMAASIFLLAMALRTIPLGTGYAVWTGIGAMGTVLFGILYLGESTDLLRMGSIALILIGLVGLKLASP
jgi:quaternary ammonium compound-resistance protein SugE